VIQNNDKVRMVFTKDSLYYFLRKIDTIVPLFKDSYTCEKYEDSLFIKTPNWITFHLLFQHNQVTFCNYKGGKGFENQIDEVYLVERADKLIYESKPDRWKNPDLFLLPYGFKGVCAIAYSQIDGKNVVYNETGSRVFSLSNKNQFLTKTHAIEDIYNIAAMNIRFYYSDSLQRLTKLTVIDKSMLSNNVFNENLVYAVNLGFNQVGRDEINSIIGERIDGNIAFFKICNKPSMIMDTDSLLYNKQYYELSPNLNE